VKLVSRKQWDARSPKDVTPLRPTHGVVVHYSASDADERSNHKNCAARVRGIQRFHMDTKGWTDIAYSFLVCKHGYVFRGRGPHARTAANGTNAGNDGYLAICFLGDDTKGRDDVTSKGRQALVDARKHLLSVHPHARETIGHRDLTSTACPGDELYAYIKSAAFRQALRKKPPAGWKPGDPIWENLPGPRPKPDWFWDALEEIDRRRESRH
jgi:N-acetylmuramoyl-L-alanine amidase